MKSPFSTVANTAVLIGALSLSCAHADFALPKADPRPPGGCYSEQVQSDLQAYNLTRLGIAEVIQNLAQDNAISAESKHQLLTYAGTFSEMRRTLPEPQPDSPEFRNFDFRFGLALTAMTLFLNSEEGALTRRFHTDRDDPDSQLGRYLGRLENSRQRYLHALETQEKKDCRT